jgi:hypothetical protein
VVTLLPVIVVRHNQPISKNSGQEAEAESEVFEQDKSVKGRDNDVFVSLASKLKLFSKTNSSPVAHKSL